ncbi:site-specific recombinase XerD [Paenibacillus castaneae]|uniref:site-specific integrase n=1 Tax=Paenibacillus TaxID=44249 RepID=UPI0011212860|nr:MULTISPECIES: site-specific integrase [Paenibacillus]NIK80547.1 site-specific recombinase XerD [Paenibacillus castaneae]
MNYVEPIRDLKQIDEFLTYIREQFGEKYWFLAMAGFNSGLRISDLLQLQVSDVKDATHLYIKEQKTEKRRQIKINPTLRQAIAKYIAGMMDDEWLFPAKTTGTPISRQYAHKILNIAAKKVGIKAKISTHSLRKSFGYHLYQNTKDVALLQSMFGHSAPSITLRYIGVNQDYQDVAMDNFSLGAVI